MVVDETIGGEPRRSSMGTARGRHASTPPPPQSVAEVPSRGRHGRGRWYAALALVLAASLLVPVAPDAAAQTTGAFECSTTNGDGAYVVPADWALKPGGLGAGDQFRLLFITSTTRNAQATDIATYNSFVQTAARAGHAAVSDSCANQFKVFGSTSTTSAARNTKTRVLISGENGLPTYWLGGAKLADNYHDLYDHGSTHSGTGWSSYAARNESGTLISGAQTPWTGISGPGNSGSHHLGAGNVVRGMPRTGQNPVSSGNVANSGLHPFYAISPLFEVDGPPTAEDDGSYIVPEGWSLKPADVGPGESFRLMFRTTSRRDATATDIATYNSFVQTEAAGGDADIRPYSAQFNAVACSQTVNLRDNTGIGATGGEPIYWMGGGRIADDYGDFLDSGWALTAAGDVRNEDGANPSDSSQWTWTGCNHDGNPGGNYLGHSSVVLYGRSVTPTHGPLSDGTDARATTRPLWALSPKFTVVERGVGLWTDATRNVDEGAGHARVWVYMTGPRPVATTVSLHEFGGAATVGDDYEAGPYELTIPAGETEGHYDVRIVDDNVEETSENFLVRLFAVYGVDPQDSDRQIPSGVFVQYPESAVVNINDNEYRTCFSETSYTAAERDGEVQLIVTLTAHLRRDTEFRFSYHDVTATGGADYTPITSLTAEAGDNSLVVPVPINWDRLSAEGDETFNVRIDSPVPPDGVTACETEVLIQNSPAPTLRVSRSSLTLDEGSSATFNVRLGQAPSSAVTVELSSDNPNIEVSPSRLTFLTTGMGTPNSGYWAQNQTVTVTAADDADDWDDETKLVLQASGGGYGDVTRRVSVMVTDDDRAASLLVPESSTLRFAEGGSASIGLRLAERPSAPVTVRAWVTDRSRSSMELRAGWGAVFEPDQWWQAPRYVSLWSMLDGNLVDDRATVRLRTSSTDPRFDGQTANVRVLVAEQRDITKPVGAVSFETATATVTETDLANAGVARLTIVRQGVSPQHTHVTVTAVSGSATAGSDYEAGPYRVLIWRGFNSASLEIPIPNDSCAEGDETFVVSIDSVSGGGITDFYWDNSGILRARDIPAMPADPAVATVTIRDDGDRSVCPVPGSVDTDDPGDGLTPEPSTDGDGDGDGDGLVPAETPQAKYAAIIEWIRTDRVADHDDDAKHTVWKRVLKALGDPDYADYPQPAMTSAQARARYENTPWRASWPARGWDNAWDEIWDAIAYAETYTP